MVDWAGVCIKKPRSPTVNRITLFSESVDVSLGMPNIFRPTGQLSNRKRGRKQEMYDFTVKGAAGPWVYASGQQVAHAHAHLPFDIYTSISRNVS